MKTDWKNDYLLGQVDGENIYLRAPEWQCGWYWAFGHMGNGHCHYHLDGMKDELGMHMRDALMAHFGETLTIGPRGLWTFTELAYTAYTLKETAEVLGRGGSHTTTNPCAELIKNEKEAKRINEKVLPAIFDEINKILTDKEYAEKEPPKTTVKYAVRVYQCNQCKAESNIGTNHYGECYPACKKCGAVAGHKFVKDIKKTKVK